MKMNYYLKRIINNKLKLGVIILLIIYPVVDIFMIIHEISRGQSVLDPNIASFLASQIFGGIQKLFFWYLPLYLLIIVADDCIEDHKFGYKQLLVTKWGKKAYFRINILKGFFFSFAAILVPLAINFAMTQIAFAGATYTGISDYTISDGLSLKNPLLTNVTYILINSFVAGIVGMGGVAISLAFRNRLIVYPTVFMMWYIPTTVMEKSIIYALQPFTEYQISDATGAIVFVFSINIIAVIFAYIKEIKYEKV